MGFCLFSLSNFTFDLNGFNLKKVEKKINVILELAHGRKFSGEQ